MVGTRTPRNDDTARIASEYAARLADARRELQSRMDATGLLARDGWRIHEEMVNASSGTAIRLRPVHRTETAGENYAIVIELK